MVPWGPMRRTIGEIAAFVTSKNAGPFLLTLDIVFPDRATYERFKTLKALDRVTKQSAGMPNRVLSRIAESARDTSGNGNLGVAEPLSPDVDVEVIS